MTDHRKVTRRSRLLAAGAISAAGTLALARVSLATPAFTDYELEAQPAYDALQAGDPAGFLGALPGYGGSLILRAPFVLVADALGANADWAFRAAALPCLIAGVILAVVLFALQERPAAAWLTLALATIAPDTLRAIEFGHPEEVLGAALCIGAVLAALRERPILAGVLLGLAVANKPWAVLAIGPVAVALGAGYVRAGAAAGALTALVWAPILLAGGGHPPAVTGTGTLFQPWQAWWFLGDPGQDVRTMTGELKDGYRAAPAWISPITRPLIVLFGFVLSAAALLVRGRDRRDAMLLLALLLLLRCVLDPWNISYYALPAVLALLAWESLHARMPVGSLALLTLTWATFQLVPEFGSPDVQAATYLAWAVPACGLMALRVFAPARTDALGARARAAVSARWSAPSAAR